MPARASRQTASLDVAELAKMLIGETRAADPLRAERLAQLGRLRTGRAAGLERERARLAEELPEDDRRVVAIDDRLGADRDLVRAVAVEADRARTEPVDVGQARALQGRVLDADLAGVPDVVVSLHDEKGVWIDALGRACTDDRGGFELRYEPSEKTEPPLETRGQAAYIRVHDAKENLLAVDKRPIVPTAGRSDYAEIILGKPPRDCPPPPAREKRR